MKIRSNVVHVRGFQPQEQIADAEVRENAGV
jgi:hypothetical protein